MGMDENLALFGNFAKLTPENRISTVILGGHEKGDRPIHQQDMVFFPREGKLKEVGIPARRTNDSSDYFGNEMERHQKLWWAKSRVEIASLSKK